MVVTPINNLVNYYLQLKVFKYCYNFVLTILIIYEY